LFEFGIISDTVNLREIVRLSRRRLAVLVWYIQHKT